ESVVCALAILKSGGAYLPLDPSQPIERLASTLDDAKPRVLITSTDLSAGLADEMLTVISDLKQDEESAEPPAVTIAATQLAYVIYTSGSSGRPKGVEVTHANLANLVTWHQQEFSLSQHDRASHLASVGFDAAVWEIWPYLTVGASLYLPDETVRLS